MKIFPHKVLKNCQINKYCGENLIYLQIYTVAYFYGRWITEEKIK